MAGKIIGATTRYQGTEFPGLFGELVLVEAVFKGALWSDYDPDDETTFITNDKALANAGGLGVADRVEVRPWIVAEGRWSFVTYDPRAVDLADFDHMSTGAPPSSEGDKP